MNTGDTIRQLRMKKGITQEELGRVIGVQKSAIRKYESGLVQNIKRSSIKKLADYFYVSPSYLLGYEDSSTTINSNGIIEDQNRNNVITLDPRRVLNPIDSAILTICESLNEKQKGEVLTFATQLLSKKGE